MWPMGTATDFTVPHISLKAMTNGAYLAAVLTESDFDEDEVALLAVESDRVRRRGVRYSSGVDEVGGCAVSLPE